MIETILVIPSSCLLTGSTKEYSAQASLTFLKNVEFLPFCEHQMSKKSQDVIQHKIILENNKYGIK